MPDLKQIGETWSGDRYGGYYVSGSLVGWRRTIADEGCFLSCVVIAAQFFGVAVSIPAMNDYLQHNGGYGISKEATVSSISGQGVGGIVSLASVPSDLVVNDEVVLEKAPQTRVALAQVRITGRAGSTATGTIVARYNSGTSIAANDKARVYGGVIGSSAAAYGGSVWSLANRGCSITAREKAEKGIIAGEPQMLWVKRTGKASPHHWLVATGWAPAYVGPVEAVGTYSINDPGFLSTRLMESEYRNEFFQVRSCTLNTGGQHTAADGRFRLTVAGPAHIEMRDPIGRQVSFAASDEVYASSIPDAYLDRRVNEWPLDGPADGDAFDVIDIPAALDGIYQLAVVSEAAGSTTIEAWGSGSNGTASVAAVRSIGSNAIDRYEVTYTNGTIPVVGIAYVSTTDVRDAEGVGPTGLTITSNPAIGQCEIALSVRIVSRVRVEVFDLGGRRQATLVDEEYAPGDHRVRWDTGSVNPGIYMVRSCIGHEVSMKKVVVVR